MPTEAQDMVALTARAVLEPLGERLRGQARRVGAASITG